jgi:murein L,D-transpeptidase YcbB/YkuD
MTDALLRLFRDLRPQLADSFSAGGNSDELLKLVLREAVFSGHLRDFYESLLPRHVQYEALRSALSQLERSASHETAIEIGRGSTLQRGDSGARVAALRMRLAVVPGSAPDNADAFDETLEAAVRRYQALHGLESDGVVGRRTQQHLDMSAHERAARIRLALARWRELPTVLGNQYVHVNIPEYRLEFIRDGSPRVQMRVVVGSKSNPTPAFSDEIEYLVFNPFWHVPRRIALEELVPKASEAPGYLTRQDYEVLRDGELIDEASVDWAAIDSSTFDFRIRQRPGPGNALGAVKFLFPNPLNIYLHDSPARGLYEHSNRAFSHGCIRLENPAQLAEALLEVQGEWSANRVSQMMAAGTRRQFNLAQSVPVYLTYITARVTETGEVALFEDVYSRDSRALKRYL